MERKYYHENMCVGALACSDLVHSVDFGSSFMDSYDIVFIYYSTDEFN